jgi:DNA-binding NarL/FixJ family response regulator
MPNVILAEDSALLRAGLAEILRHGGYGIAAAVGDADALESAVSASRPDIVITDVRMPPDFKDEGLRAALRLRERWPGLPVLVLSQYIATPYATRLFGAESARDGGLGYLLKDRVGDVTEFLDAVGRVAAGGTVLDPEVVRSMVDVQRDALAALTPREREVLALMAEGLSNQAIAERLVVTEAAVTKHIGNIFLKLDLPPEGSNRRVLAVLAHLRAGNH